MNLQDKRYYSRYKVRLEGKVALEKGFTFPVEILDISAEGARLKTDNQVPINEGDIINLVIKWKGPIKTKAEIRWIKCKKPFLEFGVKFIEMNIADREALSSLLSEIALTSLLDHYTR